MKIAHRISKPPVRSKEPSRGGIRKHRVAPCGLKHGMDPFFMGLAVAKFIPADPESWFRAAEGSKLKFGLTARGIWSEPRNRADLAEQLGGPSSI